MRERGGEVCRDTILERKGPGLMPLSGVATVYDCFVAGLNGGQLATVHLELPGLKCGLLSLVCLDICAGTRITG